MRNLLIGLSVLTVIIVSCSKGNVSAPGGPGSGHTITDTLLIFGQQGGAGKWNIVEKDYAANTTKAITFNAMYPSGTNLRVVYIKDDSILGYGNVDGVANFLITLVQPKYPQLSIDTRLICLIDHPDSTTYNLVKYDTFGVRTVLYNSPYEMTYPSFSSDGTKIAFAQKTKLGFQSIFLTNIDESGPNAHRVTPGDSTFYDDYPTITNENIYFVRSHWIDSVWSSEIFKSDLGGSVITQLTNFTNNWTTPGFSISDLRKVAGGIDSTQLICVSNKADARISNIYLYKIGTDSLNKITSDAFPESSPSMIPNWVKNH